MITHLSIRNFAIIDEISISFTDGLTVLTGETGAGKSIIIDAVHLLIGGRASSQFIKHGEERAEIVGQFELTSNKANIKQVCKSYDIPQEDDVLILERILNKNGKTVCRVNHKLVTLSVLKEIGDLITQIHSQHDTLHLLQAQQHLTLLDQYNKAEIGPIYTKYKTVYKQLLSLQQKYDKLYTDEQELAHRLDLLQFQFNELEQANLVEGEDEKLEEERKQLQNFEQIFIALQEAYHALQGEGKGLESVHIAKDALEKAAVHDSFIKKQQETLTNLYYQLEDMTFQINDYKDTLYFDENRLNDIEARLNELNRLRKKYGQTVAAMLEYKAKIAEEIDELTNRDERIELIQKEIEEKEEEAQNIAQQLHKIRKKTARQLEKDLQKELDDLYLENARISVYFAPNERKELTKDGLDNVTFMLSTNVGEPLKPLDKIASGGEMSRIMLGLKKILAEHDLIQTVIFDEIDAGVSGRVAQAIAEKMYQISTTTQTLCITHLPQVAAMADQHLLIKKEVSGDRTSTSVRQLTEDETINELGKMMTGTKLTESALEHAQELVDLTNTFKKLVRGKFPSS